ncbi:MAG TPA: lysophospholipid acyltransferase family protein [Acidobacteriota bacterium]|nr:lysophospholipid acyltransferase family protein [Acidobacteriota bacterium]
MKARHYIEFGLVWFARALLFLMPRRAAIWCGRRLGDFFYLVDRRHRSEVLQNLDTAFGEEKSKAEKKRISRKVYRHFGGIFFDFIRSPCISRRKMERITEVEGWENLEAAFEKGKGVLILTAHYGYWELMGIQQGYLGRPMSVIARRLDNPLLEKMIHRYRTRSGNRIVYKQNAVREIFKTLRHNGVAGVLIDQNINPKQGMFVDFFGVAASTTPILSAIALKSGAQIIPAFTKPLPGGRWRLIYEPALDLSVNGMDRSEAMRHITQTCTMVIENYIRRNPELWFWMHRRWKARPPAEEQRGG